MSPRHPISVLFLLVVSVVLSAASAFDAVVVKTISPGTGPPVNRNLRYKSMVTLYIDNGDDSKTPAGWSTRASDGAAGGVDQPFEFQPGVGLIEGWSEGVLQMNEGERAWLYVPAAKGYGSRPMGSPGGAGFYIPGNSDLVFDIEVLGNVGDQEM